LSLILQRFNIFQHFYWKFSPADKILAQEILAQYSLTIEFIINGKITEVEVKVINDENPNSMSQ
jgi:hypothetical protein